MNRLIYNEEIDRYVLGDYDFHCGDTLEVLINDTWVKTRFEMDHKNGEGIWYLVGLKGIKINNLIARI